MTFKKIFWAFGVCAFIFSLLIGVVEAYVRTIRIAQVTYADLHWDNAPGLIALSPSQKNGETGLLFIRLRDGKEQFLAGNWKMDFTSYGNTFIYGYPPTFSKENKQQLYYIESGEKISRVDIVNQPGEIKTIQENPQTSYLFIEFSDDKNSSFCIVERYGSGDTSCKQLDVTKISRGVWNPKKERELVIKTSASELYTFDPWEKRPIKISSSDSQFGALSALFESAKPQPVLQNILQFTFLNVLIVKEGSKFQFFRVPFNAKTAWLIDTDHILFKEKNASGILERSTKKYVPLFYDTKNTSPTITFPGINAGMPSTMAL